MLGDNVEDHVLNLRVSARETSWCVMAGNVLSWIYFIGNPTCSLIYSLEYHSKIFNRGAA